MFVLWRVTKDQNYRNWGWEMFQAFERNCRVARGYAGLSNIFSPQSKDDKMESFFLAETLKYFFMLFSDDNVLPLDGPGAYVINTECHPLAVFKD